jgi:hypothetical protein
MSAPRNGLVAVSMETGTSVDEDGPQGLSLREKEASEHAFPWRQVPVSREAKSPVTTRGNVYESVSIGGLYSLRGLAAQGQILPQNDASDRNADMPPMPENGEEIEAKSSKQESSEERI